jgi:hypothetical protein
MTSTFHRRTMLRYMGASALGLLAARPVFGNLPFGSGQTPEADRLHLVLAGYTANDDCGQACARDIEAVKRAFQSALGSRLECHDLTASSVSRLMAYLRTSARLPASGSRAVVFFYHSGHGSGLEPGKGEDSHELLINDHSARINRLQLRSVLQGRNPHGVVILTDCCSGDSAVRDVERAQARSFASVNAQTIRNLFLRMPRLINITAALPGTMGRYRHSSEVAGHGAESAFSAALLNLLHDGRTFANWNQFFPELVRMTRRASAIRGARPHEPYRFGPLQEHTQVAVAPPAAAENPLFHAHR